jgi:hypothetical protein
MFIKEIDGSSINMPARLSEVRAILSRLDEHGVQAVIKCVTENIIDSSEIEEKEKLKK